MADIINKGIDRQKLELQTFLVTRFMVPVFCCLVPFLNMVVIVKDQISLQNNFLCFIVVVAKETSL